MRDYTYQGYDPEVKQQIAEMAINGCGIRDTSRVLGISPNMVIKELKKEEEIELVNYPLLEQLDLDTLDVRSKKHRWMRCGVLLAVKKSNDGYVPSIDHATGRVLAYVLAPHKDQALVKLVNLLNPFGIKRFFTDAWGAYKRILDPNTHLIGKKNTQKIGRKHRTVRTRIKRLARKTI